jgi:hypothetical protein
MFTQVKLATKSARVKPARAWQRVNQFRRPEPAKPGMRQGDLLHDLNHFNRPVRTRMPGGVGGVRSAIIGPYPD